MDPQRVRAFYKSEFAGELGAGVAWAKGGSSVVCSRGSSVLSVDANTGVREWNFESGSGWLRLWGLLCWEAVQLVEEPKTLIFVPDLAF